jgi:hypothetical protein
MLYDVTAYSSPLTLKTQMAILGNVLTFWRVAINHCFILLFFLFLWTCSCIGRWWFSDHCSCGCYCFISKSSWRFCGKAVYELESTCQDTDYRGVIKKIYQMSPSSFNKLLTLLLPCLNVNLKQSSNTSKGQQPIVAEIILHYKSRKSFLQSSNKIVNGPLAQKKVYTVKETHVCIHVCIPSMM